MASLIAGAMSGAGEGLQTTGKMVGAAALQEQAAEIQRMRDAALQQFSREERVAGQTFTSGEKALDRASTADIHSADRGSRERTSDADRASREREGAADRDLRGRLGTQELGQRAQQIALEERKIKMLEESNVFDTEQKKAISDARKAYQEEQDPAKKQDKAAAYMTLLGKVGERYQPITETDIDGTKKVTGYFDTLSGREIKRGGAAAPSGDRPPLSAFDKSKKPEQAKPGARTSGGSISYPEALDQQGPRKPRPIIDLTDEDRMPVP